MSEQGTASPPAFNDWLAGRLGTRRWLVAPRLTDSMVARGYEVVVPRNSYTRLYREWCTLHPALVAVAALPDDFPNKAWLIDAAIAHLPMIDDYQPSPSTTGEASV